MIRLFLRSLQRHRRHVSESVHAALAAASLVLAFLLRFEFALDPGQRKILLLALPVSLIVKLATFQGFGLRDLAWRYVGFEDVMRIGGANAAAAMAAGIAVRWVIGPTFPRSIYVLDAVLCVASMTAARALGRIVGERVHQYKKTGYQLPARRILIYGAGRAGIRVCTELRAHPELGLVPVGFLDDDPSKHGLRLSGLNVWGGLKVWGGGVDFRVISGRERIEEILVAIPAATSSEIARILEFCRDAGVAVRRIPPLAELIDARILVDQIREVRIEDLLGRSPVAVEECVLAPPLTGRVVLVTGVGGSIGSELCRQIARHRPAAIVGFDAAETALYQIDQEMRETFPHIPFLPEVGNVQNYARLQELFGQHQPGAVYHAAAYKHVPMMENHPFEAVENNIFGTSNVADAAAECGAEIFVLVSSDKAVRPANIMGATKRVAEMVSLSAGFPGGKTRFLAVRFGNVLGSNGSVIPLFKRQIAAGGPVTVTHPEMRRYFMTIPEAAQLVLQASAMGRGGEIFVLDMGEPVRITDLARNMIFLSGLRPDRDIRIEYSGIRSGEKLFEELGLLEEDVISTPHHKIHIYRGRPVHRETVERMLEELRRAVEERDVSGVVLSLKKAIPDYHPSSLMLRRASEPRPAGMVASAV